MEVIQQRLVDNKKPKLSAKKLIKKLKNNEMIKKQRLEEL
jgi:hypothetical protein